MAGATRRLIDLLNLARGYLQEKGVDNPRGDAESLLGKALGLPRIELYLQHDRPLSEDEVTAFRDLLRRRGRREPLQLILGEVEFAGTRLEIVPGLLIPRSETEQLTVWIRDEIRAAVNARAIRVLDIGCGTGCIGVALAASDPRISVDAVDIEFDALRCASRNAVRNQVAGRVHTLHADVMNARFVEHVLPPYDWVVSNPPYIARGDYAGLQPEVRDHEPERALIGGITGIEFYERLAQLLPRLLSAGGRFAFEIGAGQAKAVIACCGDVAPDVRVDRDLAGIPRVVHGQLGGDRA